MGKYITHEQLPFKGKLVKIRLRTYGFNSIVTQPCNEEELLEIKPDGTVKLKTTRWERGNKKGGAKSVSLGIEIHGMQFTEPSRIASSMYEI